MSTTPALFRAKWPFARLQSILGCRSDPAFLVLLGLALWLVASWFQVGRVLTRDYISLPIWDYWRTTLHFDDYRTFHLASLWQQHNEHRIIFPELIYAADGLLLRGRQLLPLLTSVLLYFGNWLVLAYVFTVSRVASAVPRNVTILLTGIVVGCEACSQALNTPFLLAWSMAQLFSLLSFLFLSRLAGQPDDRLAGNVTVSSGRFQAVRPRNYSLAGTIVCGIIATYSVGSGLLLWPVLLAYAFLLEIAPRDLLRLIAAGVLSVGCYFIGYQSSGALNIQAILQHPLYFLGFVSSYVGMPFAGHNLLIGASNLLVFGLLLTAAVRYRLWSSRPMIVYLGAYCFALASAAITAAGRMNPADPAFIAATAVRYVTVPQVNWAVLFSAAMWLSLKLNWRLGSWRQIAAVAAGLVAGTAPAVHRWVKIYEQPVMDQQVAALSLETGLLDPDLDRKVFPDPGFVKLYLPILQTHHLSVFSFAPSSWIGRKAETIFPAIRGTGETGGLTQIHPVQTGFELVGWTDEQGSSIKLVLLNEENRVVGLGRRPRAGFPADLESPSTPAPLAWVGFIDSRIRSRAYRPYVIHGKREKTELIPAGESFPIPNVLGAEAGSLGAVNGSATWQTVEGWGFDTVPSAVRGNSFSATFLSSWNRSDQAMGSAASMPIHVNNGCFVVPVSHGPVGVRQSVRILDLQEREVASIPISPIPDTWQLFQVRTDAAHVRIFGQDSGTGWGEWVAIGQVHDCQ